MTLSIAVVCDDAPDRVTIATLAERAIREAAPWIESEAIGDYVQWRGFRRTDTHVSWADLDRLTEQLGLVVRFKGVRPLQPYSQTALRAIRVLAAAPDRVDGIILVPDSDNKPGRLKGLRQARDYSREALPIVVGVAHTKRECWHICGFEPGTDAEREAVIELRSEIGFDYRHRSHELTAARDATHDKRSAKRVLAKLTGDDRERELRCLTDLPLAELHARGGRNGLAALLDEIRAVLVPLFGH